MKTCMRQVQTTFIEVGPGNKLTGLVGSILTDKVHEAFSMDASSGKSSGLRDLAVTIARLAASGFNVNLTKWNEGVAVSGNRYKKEKICNLVDLRFQLCSAQETETLKSGNKS